MDHLFNGEYSECKIEYSVPVYLYSSEIQYYHVIGTDSLTQPLRIQYLALFKSIKY